MPSDTTQQIKDKLDIVDFLKQYLELRSAGKNFKALCPFHKEKTPSFMVSPDRQAWHCFGSCGDGGDIIKFLMKYENLEFYDALKILAEKAGVELKDYANRDFKSFNALYVLMADAKDFFRDNLFKSRQVLDYLKERGLMEETVREFELGLAPDGSDILTRYILKKGYKIEDIEKAGLTIKTERGTYWDRFRSRLMFPIYNHIGKVVAFTGRVLPWNDNSKVGKYVNSPETPIFQKSKVLYGFHKTKNDIHKANSVVLVEGQMDFLMIWQDGVKNAAATSGTALTEEHLKILRRLTDELILSFDADEAGQAAAERAMDLAGANDFSVKFLVIDDKKFKDPADVVKSGPGKIKELADKSKSAMEYLFYKYIKNIPDDQKLKKNNIRIVLSKIKNLSSAIDRSHWLKKLAELVNIDEKSLFEEMDAIKSDFIKKSPVPSGEEIKEEVSSHRDLIIQRLFGIFLYKNNLKALNDYTKYFPERYAEIYKNIENEKDAPDSIKDMINTINLRFSFENQNLDDEKLNKELKMLERGLKMEFLNDRQKELIKLRNIAEKNGDKENEKKYLDEFAVVSKELYTIKTIF